MVDYGCGTHEVRCAKVRIVCAVSVESGDEEIGRVSGANGAEFPVGKSRENLNCVHRNGYDMPTGVSLHASQGVGSSGEAWINAAIRIQPVKGEAAIHYFLLVVPSGDELTIILGKQGGRYEE